ncbi:MAG TPA: hypothetical protein VKT21_02390, partial [Thermoplasmata archaeon]|nr:hypothetical protein [Thermoplasmata archaeon]
MRAPGQSVALAPADFWDQLRHALLRRYPGLSESTAGPPPRRRKPVVPRIVGHWAGRGWEISFHAERPFVPENMVGVTTVTRLSDPRSMLGERMPWVYVGPRPGVFSKNSFDFDRIVSRYRKLEGDYRGVSTGDPAFDRRWAVYPWDPTLGEVFRDSATRSGLDQMATARPPRGTLPTIAVLGSVATLTLVVQLSSDRIDPAVASIGAFSGLLDKFEAARGLRPAQVIPIPTDLLPDEDAVPYPVVAL